MNELLIIVTTIDLVLAILILMISIFWVKRQDRLRHDYFLFKKRMRILQSVKSLYYSYCLYRESTGEKGKTPEVVLQDHSINQLVKNEFFGETLNLFAGLNKIENEVEFRAQMNRLDGLSDDFSVLYPPKASQQIESFIFWYRLLLIEIASYKKSQQKDERKEMIHTISVIHKMKQLEAAYQELSDNFLLQNLQRQANLSKQ